MEKIDVYPRLTLVGAGPGDPCRRACVERVDACMTQRAIDRGFRIPGRPCRPRRGRTTGGILDRPEARPDHPDTDAPRAAFEQLTDERGTR